MTSLPPPPPAVAGPLAVAVEPPEQGRSGDRSLGRWTEELRRAVVDGGGRIVPAADAEALVWTAWDDPSGLAATLQANPAISWVQLCTAGVDELVDVLDADRAWTCGKGAFAGPIAEYALAGALAGHRLLGYVGARSWGRPSGRALVGAEVVVVGGGGIARELLDRLAPFGARTTVVRNRPEPVAGATRVVGPDELHAVLPGADVVVLALALTPATTGLIGRPELEAMASHAWLVNVSRGAHVVTDELVEALRDGAIGGAVLDVTDPEPLPAGHPLWELPNCLITPHTACTVEMGQPLMTARVRENVARRVARQPLVGEVDVAAGY